MCNKMTASATVSQRISVSACSVWANRRLGTIPPENMTCWFATRAGSVAREFIAKTGRWDNIYLPSWVTPGYHIYSKTGNYKSILCTVWIPICTNDNPIRIVWRSLRLHVGMQNLHTTEIRRGKESVAEMQDQIKGAGACRNIILPSKRQLLIVSRLHAACLIGGIDNGILMTNSH